MGERAPPADASADPAERSAYLSPLADFLVVLAFGLLFATVSVTIILP